jgi:hypothetical protein
MCDAPVRGVVDEVWHVKLIGWESKSPFCD